MKIEGFTLVEIVVVIALFGLLSMVAANFLVSVIQSSNRTTIENEVRENASRIMEDIASEVRGAGCVWYDNAAGSMRLYPDARCASSASVTYSIDAAGVFSKQSGVGAPVALSSPKVAVCSDSGSCSSSGCSPRGLTVTPTSAQDPSLPLIPSSARAIIINLSVRQNSISTRQDFCAKVNLENTVSPRNTLN